MSCIKTGLARATRRSTRRSAKDGRRTARVIASGLLVALLVPLVMLASGGTAFADDDNPDNYSLYQMASNASTYFSQENSPAGNQDPSDRMTADWRKITSSPATGGDMLGYADPKFSVSHVVGWLFAEVSGSSQTIGYDTLKATASTGGDTGGKNAADIYAGMLDYGHFGATNNDLGLDTMSSGIGGQIINVVGGSIIWGLYALALAVSMLFYLVIQLLKLTNPFLWFDQAVSSINQTFGEGMTRGENAPAALKGLTNFVQTWYGTLDDLAWQALVPLFIGFTVFGLVMFKKLDRGSAVRKLIVRLVFIGFGLPLIGSMYTGVLGKFDDSLLGEQSGPTRVVLSTYVDFNAWAMDDRLAVPDGAEIGWDDGQASSQSLMSVRTTALSINKQSHGSTFAGINVGDKATDAESAWKDGTTGADTDTTSDASAVSTTFDILDSYISSNEVASSDFESGIKSSLTHLDVDTDIKKQWFVDKAGYGDVEGFGEEGSYLPTNHPVLAVGDQGLTSSTPGGATTTFTTPGVKTGCGFTVWTDNAPAPCNLSALSMYNYLNTGFGTDSLTLYSSNNATSGFTRENHMAVSQVGTGPAKLMYWFSAATVLGSIALLGFWYAIGMFVGAVKRTFSLVAAVPFATLGALQAIAKVIVYSAALILEVLVTLFLWQFVGQFLISVPDILAGPLSSLMSSDGLLGSSLLGGIVVVVLTMISSILVMGVTFALLRARKVVLQALDEACTKLIDKFLETNSAPQPDKSGLMPAAMAGVGAGAGMALGNKVASGLGGKLGRGPKAPAGGGKPGGGSGPTNAGGTNGDPKALPSTRPLALEGGPESGGDGPAADSPAGGGIGSGPDGSGPRGTGSRAWPAEAGVHGAGTDGDEPGDAGGRLQAGRSTEGSARSDRETAHRLSVRGGLSKLGFGSPGRKDKAGGAQFVGAPVGSGRASGTGDPTSVGGPRPGSADKVLETSEGTPRTRRSQGRGDRRVQTTQFGMNGNQSPGQVSPAAFTTQAASQPGTTGERPGRSSAGKALTRSPDGSAAASERSGASRTAASASSARPKRTLPGTSSGQTSRQAVTGSSQPPRQLGPGRGTSGAAPTPSKTGSRPGPERNTPGRSTGQGRSGAPAAPGSTATGPRPENRARVGTGSPAAPATQPIPTRPKRVADPVPPRIGHGKDTAKAGTRED